ncbi:hypothetical protein CLIB1423_04S00958 [[Candida] railenensis]|uniref:VPS37 C-terminal domain-containing protein n=1 Tax=[Candida] railenensis TaxID=45579 RepID=A0A9P0QMQ9_9ASCO|nr:hypothetical protein CLIB1423_04S00958 [[Candida] railenensis]
MEHSTLRLPSVEELKPFPLPKQLSTLPEHVLREFSQSYELVNGYVQSLPQFKGYQEVVVQELNQQIHKINVCCELLNEYSEVAERIKNQTQSLNSSYGEWTNLETIQYQLLSANFNQESLKKKFEKHLNETNQQSYDEIKKFKNSSQSESDFADFVENFRKQRKTYHSKKEKMNRWNEERVTGFV